MPIDLRVVKTHRHIRDALVELLQDRAFGDIVVQDILDQALVNRSTFYKYYSGKGDLAEKMIADFKAEYAALLRARFDRSGAALSLGEATSLLYQRRKMLLGLWKIATRRLHLYHDMHDMLRQEFIRHARTTIPGVSEWDYQGCLFATLVLTTARHFFERDLPIPFAEMPGQWQQMLDLVRAN